MKKCVLFTIFLIIIQLCGCVSNEEWVRLFEKKAESLRQVCGKYRLVAANDEARKGMSEECLMQTKYQFAQINTTIAINRRTSRYETIKKFSYLSIQGPFTKMEYVVVVDGIVKRVPKLLEKPLNVKQIFTNR